jgi:hypothetical protein
MRDFKSRIWSVNLSNPRPEIMAAAVIFVWSGLAYRLITPQSSAPGSLAAFLATYRIALRRRFAP